MQRLLERMAAFGRPKVALVGDFLLDGYVFGDVERINPEAPVPILRVRRREQRVGGAGNVAAALPALGAEVVCCGMIGADPAGEALLALLAEAGADVAGLGTDPARPTSVKTRYVGLAQHRHAQQILRVDDEQDNPLSADAAEAICRRFAQIVADCAIVGLEDYNKGALAGGLAERLIGQAHDAGKRVVVDPALIEDYGRYRGADLITPNRYEASTASGIEIRGEADLEPAGRALIERAGLGAVCITLDKEGCFLVERGGGARRIPTRPRQVYDVTGAGDEVLAMLLLALAEGADLDTAAGLANVAGGLEVERFGVVPIGRAEVQAELGRMIGLRGAKVLDRRVLAGEVARRKSRGEKVVFTNGCFDLLHMGHVRYLQQARELGDCLIVAVNADAGVARLKGPSRPVIGEDERAAMLASLECVDYVTIFGEDTPEALLETLRPDMLVKGGTTDVVVGREIVEGYGGKVLCMPAVEGLSTTEIINRIVRGGS